MTTNPFPPYRESKPSGVAWIGAIPAHWLVIGLSKRYSVQLGKMLDEKRITGAHLVPYLRNVDVRWDHIRTHDLPQMDISPAEHDRYTLRPGDMLVCEGGEVGRAAFWRGELPLCGYQKALHRVRALKPEVDNPRYLYYCMLVASTLGVFTAHGNENTFAHLTAEKLRAHRFPFPPKSEQDAVVAFLDHFDTLVNRFIRAKRRLIELLNEQKQAIIHQAVTRGLDPDVPLKPSGIDWLGDIPAHWEEIRIGKAAKVIQTGPFGSQLHATDYVEGGIPIVNPSHIRGGRIVPDPSATVDEPTLRRLAFFCLKEGDIVLARRGELGRCALVTAQEEGFLCGTGSLFFRPVRGLFNERYLLMALSTPGVAEHLTLSSVGSTMANLNSSIVARLQLPKPPFHEQNEIVRFVERVAFELDRATGVATREITLVREYRTRLISDVVTGKIDVRNAVPDDLPPIADESFGDMSDDGESDGIAEQENDADLD